MGLPRNQFLAPILQNASVFLKDLCEMCDGVCICVGVSVLVRALPDINQDRQHANDVVLTGFHGRFCGCGVSS